MHFSKYENNLPNSKSAQAKFPINKCVGERKAKSIHNAIKTRIFPSIVKTIIVDRQQVKITVHINGRVRIFN